MGTVESLYVEETSANRKQWEKLYLIGGCAALLSFCGTLADIIFGSASSVNLSELPQTAIERFAEFQQSWLLGLYHLDLLNVIIAIIMIPAFFALFALHRKSSLPYAGFALILSIIGTTIFVSTNSALPMLELGNKYYSAVDEAQRTLIAAAGEAMLVRGAHGGLGVFIGFVLSIIASLCMALVMLQGKIFNRVVSYFGIIGNTLLLIYILLVTFVPAVQNIATIIAAPGGILALVWVLMQGTKLIKMGCYSFHSPQEPNCLPTEK
jgi:hypothetical protein